VTGRSDVRVVLLVGASTMKLPAVLVVFLVASPALAQQEAPTTPSDSQAQTFHLPVSVDHIREALEEQPATVLTLDTIPTFRVLISERQRIDDLVSTLDFRTTRQRGGLYWNEIQRLTWPAVDNPYLQPYSGFSTGEQLQLAAESALEMYLATKLVQAIGGAIQNHRQTAAKREVQQAIQDYCAAQPDGGIGIQICSTTPSVR
jgi:hypothetical protein